LKAHTEKRLIRLNAD